jgi:hypothetical protein
MKSLIKSKMNLDCLMIGFCFSLILCVFIAAHTIVTTPIVRLTALGW